MANRNSRNSSTVVRAGLSGAVAVLLAACGEESQISRNADTGPDPKLDAPRQSWIPTVNIAPAVGWPDGGKPVATAGLAVIWRSIWCKRDRLGTPSMSAERRTPVFRNEVRK